jgi:acyl-CoA-binding protein
MKKTDAINTINNALNLDDKFNIAYDVLEHSPPISQDKMLMLYAYYKQALFGDFVENEETGQDGISNYIQTFKNNAWSQVRNLTSTEAKEKYIEFTLKVIEEDYKD